MLWMITGIIVISVIMVDVIWTAVSTQGGGMITSPLARGIDRIMAAGQRSAPKSSRFSLSGPLAVTVVMALWILGLWLGWLLMFSAESQWVVDGKTNSPTDWVGRIYYVGFTVSTLGIGDIKPAGEIAQILTPVAAFNGLTVATLAITYIVSLVSASVQKRQLAFSISGLGSHPAELLQKAWNGQNYRGLELPFNTISTQLSQSAEQRLAYPILDNFHSQESGGALSLQVAVLDEALSLLMHGVEKSQQPEPAVLENLHSALTHYLDRIAEGIGPVKVDVPDVLPLGKLAESGPTLKAESDYRASMEAQGDRRQLLHQLIRNDGWVWTDVVGSDS